MSGIMELAKIGNSTVEGADSFLPFAVHNGGTLFLFCAQEQAEFDNWVRAFGALEDSMLNAVDREMWVDVVR